MRVSTQALTGIWVGSLRLFSVGSPRALKAFTLLPAYHQSVASGMVETTILGSVEGRSAAINEFVDAGQIRRSLEPSSGASPLLSQELVASEQARDVPHIPLATLPVGRGGCIKMFRFVSTTRFLTESETSGCGCSAL